MKKILIILIALTGLLLSSCADANVQKNDDWQIEKSAVRMIRVDGELYFDSGTVSSQTPRCGTLDGSLIKNAESNEIPVNDNECNFDGARGFQIATSITKEVPIEDGWIIFKKFEREDIDLSDYKYCYYIKGRMPNAAKDTEIIVISEDENVSFKDIFEPLFSSQFNPDEKGTKSAFVICSNDDKWGINLTVKDVTNKGLTIVCEQFGGNPSGELQTGAWYSLEENIDGEWVEVKTKPQDNVIAWNDMAYLIPKNEKTEWEVNWEWLYGELEEGTYRIGKEITDFRKTGDYDKEIYYVTFTIEEQEPTNAKICSYPLVQKLQ